MVRVARPWEKASEVIAKREDVRTKKRIAVQSLVFGVDNVYLTALPNSSGEAS
jgi:hypothetical protein